MVCHVVRYQKSKSAANSQVFWGVIEGEHIKTLDQFYETTQQFLNEGRANAFALAADDAIKPNIQKSEVRLLSPVTKPCQVLCQGANYRQHIIESGMNPDDKKYNMFFNKSSASISGPTDNVEKPDHVVLLDYEVELGLVIGKEIKSNCSITDENIGHYVAGIVIGNDISARDVQVPQMQFFKGKSYRSFCPVGPVLCLLQPEDAHYLHDMLLTLTVNGEVRQQDTTRNLVFKPAETLTELSTVADLYVGDLVLTGTPAGCAMRIPPAFIARASGLLPDRVKWSLFTKMQAKRSQYLQRGDLIRTRIESSDGVIDLGIQENRVA